MKKKRLLSSLIALFFLFYTQAQVVWYENESNTSYITLSSATKGTFSTNEVNPETIGINTNSVSSKFIRDGQVSPFIYFNLPIPVTDLTTYSIALKAYTSITTPNLTTTNKRIRVYFRNSTIGASSAIYKQLNFSLGETWEDFTFIFDGTSIPTDVASAGGYDQIMIGVASGDTTSLTSTYYFDTISGTTTQETEPKAEWLSGSWGFWYQLPGGIRLDSNPADYVKVAQQMVADLPSMGHVMLNFTHSAHGYFFLLRENPYIDIATEIHSDMVPSLVNEQMILDVIEIFKNAGKKVILYIATDGPSARSGTPDNPTYKAAWENYYLNTPLFTGSDEEKEAQAYRLLCKGFFERFKDAGVDGYWLDHSKGLPGELEDFVKMITKVDPNAALATNNTLDDGKVDLDPDYFQDAYGNDLYVDTDDVNEQVGVNDDGINKDYRIKKFNASDPYMDFTGGHPTPLALGAPPTSWAYEEYTFPDMVENPWDTYNGAKQVVKHAFIPLRSRWTVFTSDFMFNDDEQAYRIVRTLTDAGAAITWSATLDGSWYDTDGNIMQEEMDLFKEINNRMVQNPKPDYIPYSRPEGAYLVGESLSINDMEKTSITLYPNPVKSSFKISKKIESVHVYNTLGQKLISFSENKTEYDISRLSKGIYFVETIFENKLKLTTRIVKK